MFPCRITRLRFGLTALVLLATTLRAVGDENQAAKVRTPLLVGHRGLIRHAPENTLATFAACLDLRLGFELDIRRTRDGRLVCLHDDDVQRTTNGWGKVSKLSLAELRDLDAGSWFDPTYAGQRVPTLEEVFRLVGERKSPSTLIALDLKIDDATVAADVVRLAAKNDILQQVVFIGLAIGEPSIRRKLKAADPNAPVAALAQTADDLPSALAEADANWVYVRFIPDAEQAQRVHKQGKRLFIAGTSVSGNVPAAWRRAAEAGIDAILTDFPLECRIALRSRPAP